VIKVCDRVIKGLMATKNGVIVSRSPPSTC
jgi:hypothetical protein